MLSAKAPISRFRFVHTLLRARDWQDRPELTQLCEWWRRGRVGACVLVGIGGAGKSAIAERFLRILPGGLPALDGVAKDSTLRPPARLFVFSFYDAPNPDHFFAELYSWVTGIPVDYSLQAPSYQEALQQLASLPPEPHVGPASQHSPNILANTAALLLLDGLEKVQDSNSGAGGLGRLFDKRLRDFVFR